MDKINTKNRLFFSAKVPILQNRVYADEKSAKAAPYGSLDIRVEPVSGLAVNVEYDQRSVRYDRRYDNSVPSDAFLKYYDDIADYVVARYDLTKGVIYSLYLFNRDVCIDHCVDINTRKQGKYCPLSGLKIISPETLVTDQEYAVICMNPNYVSEIQEHCSRLKFDARFFNPDVEEIV